MDFQTLITHNPFLAYLMSGAFGGILGGLLLLFIQTILKQGVAYQYKKKLEEIKHDHNKTLRDISHEYEKNLKDFNHEYDEKLRDLNHHYDEKLAKFNEQITIQADYRRLEFDRKIHDFSIYSTKRHEVYPELHRMIVEMSSDYNRIDDIEHLLITVTESKDEIVSGLRILGNRTNSRILCNLAIDNKFLARVNKIISDVEDFDVCLGEVNKFLKHKLLSAFKDTVNLTENFFTENSLYFSEDISQQMKKLFSNLNYLILFERTPEYENNAVFLARDLEQQIIQLTQSLKEELSIGDYSRTIENM